MLKTKFQVLLTGALLAGLVGLGGCGGGGGATGSVMPSTTPTAAAILLGSSSSSVTPDGSKSATITANVVDANNLPVAGATVKFGASGGTLGVSSGVSDATGVVSIAYTAVAPNGTINKSDRTELITATVVGSAVTAQIPIKVSSSALLISLGTSSATVNSDGSNSATITATVTDPNNIPVSGATVTFSAATGQLGSSSGPSSAAGIVTIPFSAVALDKVTGAPIDKTNRTEIIVASVAGTSATAQIPIQVVGSLLILTPSLTTVPVGGTVTLTAGAKDASQAGVSGQSLRFSIPAGSGTLSGGSGSGNSATLQLATTLTSGAAPAITFIPSVAANVPVSVDWLNAAGNVTLTATTAINVTVVGVSFAVTLPTSKPTPLTLGGSQAMSVSVPPSISGAAVASVRFSTTLGTWSNATKVSTMVPVANAVHEILAGGAFSGTASVQIEALDTSGKQLAKLNHSFALSAPATAAGAITLQSSISNVAPSVTGANSATLTATVRTSGGGNSVSGAAVLFEIMNPTGSGEQIKPAIAITNDNGQAEATFTAGSQSTVGGLKIKASVVGTPANCDNSVSPPLAGICDVKAIFVNASGVSVSLGFASVINSVDDNTNYQLPMSVLVVDNAGTAVKNALVTLSAFPTQYLKGFRDSVTCAPTYSAGYPLPNEDLNENDNMDPGEDLNGDGIITPAHSTAGTLPSTVTTGANGVATFNLTYQKQYASWVQARVRAKVVVSTGTTESTNELKFILPYSLADTTDCTLSNSPGGW